MPSLFEPAGVVFTEAAAAGLPSIAGTNGGSADFVGDGGVMVNPESDDQILLAMQALADPERARQVGSAAAARSMLFTWGAVAARLLHGLGLATPAEQSGEFLPFRDDPQGNRGLRHD
jgi:glycosyltransferase involved in cell wall biosynthesis